jgi:hypothetical protein
MDKRLLNSSTVHELEDLRQYWKNLIDKLQLSSSEQVLPEMRDALKSTEARLYELQAEGIE